MDKSDRFSDDLIGGKTPIAPRCYVSHPPLDLGGGKLIYGGSCWSPIIKDADVYIGLDAGMPTSPKSYPWEPGQAVLFRISDGQAPTDKTGFVNMIGWLAARIEAGDKVHVGCIGGHGRTGMVLSALVALMLGEKNAIDYVRAHYCKKAVETAEQVDFLAKVFDITKTKALRPAYTASPPSKFNGVKASTGGGKSVAQWGGGYTAGTKSYGNDAWGEPKSTAKITRHGEYRPVSSISCMWGETALPKLK